VKVSGVAILPNFQAMYASRYGLCCAIQREKYCVSYDPNLPFQADHSRHEYDKTSIESPPGITQILPFSSASYRAGVSFRERSQVQIAVVGPDTGGDCIHEGSANTRDPYTRRSPKKRRGLQNHDAAAYTRALDTETNDVPNCIVDL
jgi:hypothetical protein